jgi:hypothetical protein
VILEEGGEYAGERYIRCWKCPEADGARFLLFEGRTMPELLEFLRHHGAI